MVFVEENNTSLFVEGLLEGGVRTTDGAPVFVCTIKKKQRKGIADWLLQGGGGAEQHKGPQSLFVE